MATDSDLIFAKKSTAKRSASPDGDESTAPKKPADDNGNGTTPDPDPNRDSHCWQCHKPNTTVNCKICPRSYHSKCINESTPQIICPECVVTMQAENVETRSQAMKNIKMEDLQEMLMYISGRMRATPGVEPFLKPVSPADAEDYYEYIKYPMDIATIEKNIKQRHYGSTEAFLSDCQWIVHNSIVFNSVSSPYTAAAKKILKVCRSELSEIETCPECYANAHKTGTWFIECCKHPHILVWAKLKGFPFWPAKAMKIKDDSVDVRFFGQHDRAWVNLKDCYLYSEENPSGIGKKSAALSSALDELAAHTAKLVEKYGEVKVAPVKTPLSEISVDRLKVMLPGYTQDSAPVLDDKPQSEPLEKFSSADNSTGDPPIDPIEPKLSVAEEVDNERPGSPGDQVELEAKPEVAPPIDEVASTPTTPLITQINQTNPGTQFNISRDVSISKVTPPRSLTRPKLETPRGYGHGRGMQGPRMPGRITLSNTTPDHGITLPGGTITVTPLTSMVYPNSLPISVVQPESGGRRPTPNSIQSTPSNPIQATSTPVTRRQTTLTLPPSISAHMKTFLGSFNENFKQTIEKIAIDVLEGGQVEHDEKKIKDLIHNHDITVREMRLTFEADKKRSAAEFRRQLAAVQEEKRVAIEETKRKQWCVCCSKEAMFYCCWNTSYCGFECQELHWSTHMTSCTQAGHGQSQQGGQGQHQGQQMQQ